MIGDEGPRAQGSQRRLGYSQDAMWSLWLDLEKREDEHYNDNQSSK